MSHNIQNLTSHLKNTTITPTSPPKHLSSSPYRTPGQGLRVYHLEGQAQAAHQKNQIMANHCQIKHLLDNKLLPQHDFPVAGTGTGSKNNLNNKLSIPPGTTLTPSPAHFASSQGMMQQQYSPLQQQLRKPSILAHPQNRLNSFPSTVMQGIGMQAPFHPSTKPLPKPGSVGDNLSFANNSTNNFNFASPQYVNVSKSPVRNRSSPGKNVSPSPRQQNIPNQNQNRVSLPNNSGGGAARVHQISNHRKSEPSSATITSKSQPKKHISKNGLGLKTAIKMEDDPLALPITEPGTEKVQVKRVPKPFQKGDDVLFRTDDDSYMFGSIGMIHGDTIQVLFGDGTQQLASFDRVKLLCSVDDDEEEEKKPSKSGKGHGKGSSLDQGLSAAIPVNEEVTCGSCGVMKKVAGKKALNFAPYTKTQFNCRRCLNKSRCSKNGMSISMYSGRGKSTTSGSPSSKSGGEPRRQSGESTTIEKCFHCDKATNYNDRLHCNLCERACHLSCLAMSPTPLEGDRFWDVICSACGTQTGESGSSGRSKVYSCRRSISSWSDVAHLVLSCLSSHKEHYGERFFDLDLDMIPFIDNNIDRLHLPRAYKNVLPDNRKNFLSTALHNATLRFTNGGEVSRRDSLWAIRENSASQQSFPLRLQLATTPKKSPNTPNGARVVRTASSSATKNVSSSPQPLGRKTTPEGTSQSLRTQGSPGIVGTLAKRSSKDRNGEATPSPPKLDRYDGSSPSPKGRVSLRKSHKDRLVQKAKKQCLQKRQEVVETTTPNRDESRKRKPADDFEHEEDDEWCAPSSPHVKRLKFSSPSTASPRLNGLVKPPSRSPPKYNLPPEQMNQWLNQLNASTPSRNSHHQRISPSISDRSPMFGKAVKSAGITPPGTLLDRVGLRARKIKSFKLLQDSELLMDSSHANGIVSKLKGRGRPAGKSLPNAAALRFSQIPLTNGAVQPEVEETVGEFSLMKATVEDLASFGTGYTVSVIPTLCSPEDVMKMQKKAGEAYELETTAIPAYLKPKGIKPRPWERSKRNLKDLDSYKITGVSQTASGTMYHIEWMDGYGNDSDEDDTEKDPGIDWDDLNDAAKLVKIGEGLSLQDGDGSSKKVEVGNGINGLISNHLQGEKIDQAVKNESTPSKPLQNGEVKAHDENGNGKVENGNNQVLDDSTIKNEPKEEPLSSSSTTSSPKTLKNPFSSTPNSFWSFNPLSRKSYGAENKSKSSVVIDLTADSP